MSLLDDIYGDDSRTVLQIALDQATPNRTSRAWVRHRVEEVIGQLSTVLMTAKSKNMVQAFTRKGLI